MIKVLEKNIADKIAAGEVIERPVSIVKELIENSIDAGASSIIVEIKNGGKSYIRVTDDGCGIAEEEVETAFLRHATSKIETVTDLDAIGTLGFRGEALASIGAVTRTEILTKRREAKTGRRVLLHGGETLANEKTGCPDGTTMIVTDLFYNTPARLKFMKSDSAESGLIIDLVSQVALAYKNIKFRLINNGNILFSTQGDGNRFNTIARIYKNIDPKNLTPISWEEGKLKLEGYISTPAMSRTTRSSQIFFVNGRVVSSKVIERGLEEGYRERLFDGRHPVAFLFLETDPADLDVNIHPNKKEVRFDYEAEIVRFVSRAVQNALGTKEGIVNVGNIFKDKDSTAKEDEKKEKQVDIKTLLSSMPAGGTKVKDSASLPYNKKVTVPPEPERTVKAASSVRTLGNKSHLPQSILAADDIPEKIETPEPVLPAEEPHLTIEAPRLKPFDFDELTVTGTIFNTYITATDENSFYLIDQHAAHERIFYEKLVGEYEREEKLRQPIMIPLMLNTTAAVDETKYTWFNALEKMGFTLEEFGQNTYRVTEIPTFMDISEAEDYLNFFMDNVGNGTNLRNTVVINKLIMKSCKSAVKAHDVLSMDEIKALIKDLKNCVNPFSCPHGRPTFIRLTQYEIERLFKRIQS